MSGLAPRLNSLVQEVAGSSHRQDLGEDDHHRPQDKVLEEARTQWDNRMEEDSRHRLLSWELTSTQTWSNTVTSPADAVR